MIDNRYKVRLVDGILYDPWDPSGPAPSPETIAHGLAHLCRYGGHTQRFYCPTEDQRVLTADLQWVPAGDLTLGQELVGFDEHPIELGQAGKRKRRFRPNFVTHLQRVKTRVFRLELSDGSTVTASGEHPWLIATKQSGNQKWMPVTTIVRRLADGCRQYLNRFSDTWKTDNTRDGGWLAGMYDGEGHVSFRDRSGIQMGVAQKRGLVLDRLVEVHKRFGFDYLRFANTGTYKDVINLQILGGWRQAMKLLGSIRPLRLLENFRSAFTSGAFCKQMNSIGDRVEILKAYDEGEQWVCGLETSTHTYLCEGFAAHNSVAEHSIWVALHLACGGSDNSAFKDAALALAAGSYQNIFYCCPADRAPAALLGLVHDASEGAGLVDVPGPIGAHPEMVEYKRAHARCTSWLCREWGVAETPDLHERVKVVDYAILGPELAVRPGNAMVRDGSGEQSPLWPNLDLGVDHDLSLLGLKYARKAWVAAYDILKGLSR